MKARVPPPPELIAAPPPVPAPGRERGWGGFWRWMIAVLVGFALPTLACYGLILISALGIQILSLGNSSAGTSTIGGPSIGPAVGVVRVNGILASERDPLDYTVSSSRNLIDFIDRAAADPEVRSLVLAVNSPGGSVVASDEVHHALEGFPKPVVVTMGEIAASGGYYISAGADWIIANPNSLTGSIGVISEFPNASGLLEKVGVDYLVITSGPRKDFGSPYREMTAEERRYWQATVDEIFEGFVQIVAAGRGLSEEEVLALADGSVYTGRQALGLGLIDALGYEEDAIAKAADLGGIQGQPRIIEYSAPAGIFDLFRYAVRRGSLPTWSELLTWVGHPSVAARWVGP